MNSLKSVAKIILPRTLLKKAFLIYNVLKANSFDLLFFQQHAISKEAYTQNVKKNPFTELNVDVSIFNSEVQKKLSLWLDPLWTQDQYLLHYKQPGFIEPCIGWGLSRDNHLIYPSLGFATAPHVHKPSVYETYFRKPITLRIPKIISLRDTGEENYFHFFNDVISKLFYLKENGIILSDYTIVISERLYSKPFFQFYLKSQFLASLHWHVQKDEWVEFDEAIFCKPFTHTKRYFDFATALVNIKSENVGERRIFLTRSSKSMRFVENYQEIKPILEKFKFETIEASNLSFEEQSYLFSNCRYLVAIHGAGITNIIFRKNKPLSLLEIIHPHPYIPFHYIMLAKLSNFDYSVLLGSTGRQSRDGGFRVNPVDLEKEIVKMITPD